MLALSVVMINFDLVKTTLKEVARLIAARFDKLVLVILLAVVGVTASSSPA